MLSCLRSVFQGSVMAYKPRTCHAHRDSYYVVCRGWDPDAAANVKVWHRRGLEGGRSSARERLSAGCVLAHGMRVWCRQLRPEKAHSLACALSDSDVLRSTF